MFTKVARNWRRRFMTRLTNDQFLWRVPQINIPGAAGRVDSPGIAVKDMMLQNRTGSTLAAGLVLVLPNAAWVAGQWTNATTLFTDDTTDAQDTGASDFPLCNTTNNDGSIFACRVPFNVLGLDVDRVAAGGTPVYELAYSQDNGAGGVAWATIPVGTLYSATGYTPPDFSATGERPIVFPIQADFRRTIASGDLATGLDAGYYAVRLRASTAPASQGANATVVILGRAYGMTQALADNGVLEWSQHETSILESDHPERIGIGIAPIFLLASDGNYVEVGVRPCG